MRSILADTSGGKLGITAIDGLNQLFSTNVTMKRNMIENFLKILDVMLDSSKVELKSFDEFYVVTGPGSYTGVRVGVSSMLGLSSGMGKELKGICSLDAGAIVSGLRKGRIHLKLGKGLYVYRDYDFDEMKFSDFVTDVKKDDLAESYDLKDIIDNNDLSRAVESEYFSHFVRDYAPLYFRKSEAEINFDKRSAC